MAHVFKPTKGVYGSAQSTARQCTDGQLGEGIWPRSRSEVVRRVTGGQEILGHREFTMTLRDAHLNPDRLRDAVASLERFSARKAHGDRLDLPSAAAAPKDAGMVDAPVAQLDRATVS